MERSWGGAGLVPDEQWLDIFGRLSARDVLRASFADRRFRSLALQCLAVNNTRSFYKGFQAKDLQFNIYGSVEKKLSESDGPLSIRVILKQLPGVIENAAVLRLDSAEGFGEEFTVSIGLILEGGELPLKLRVLEWRGVISSELQSLAPILQRSLKEIGLEFIFQGSRLSILGGFLVAVAKACPDIEVLRLGVEKSDETASSDDGHPAPVYFEPDGEGPGHFRGYGSGSEMDSESDYGYDGMPWNEEEFRNMVDPPLPDGLAALYQYPGGRGGIGDGNDVGNEVFGSPGYSGRDHESNEEEEDQFEENEEDQYEQNEEDYSEGDVLPTTFRRVPGAMDGGRRVRTDWDVPPTRGKSLYGGEIPGPEDSPHDSDYSDEDYGEGGSGEFEGPNPEASGRRKGKEPAESNSEDERKMIEEVRQFEEQSKDRNSVPPEVLAAQRTIFEAFQGNDEEEYYAFIEREIGAAAAIAMRKQKHWEQMTGGKKELKPEEAMPLVKDFDSAVEKLLKGCKALTLLELPSAKISHFKTRHDRLQTLTLTGMPKLAYGTDAINDLTSHFPALRHLSLTSASPYWQHQQSQESLGEPRSCACASSTLENLEMRRFMIPPSLTLDMPRLKRLFILKTTGLENRGPVPIGGWGGWGVRRQGGPQPSDVRDLQLHCPGLEELRLGFPISNATLAELSEACPALRTLALDTLAEAHFSLQGGFPSLRTMSLGLKESAASTITIENHTLEAITAKLCPAATEHKKRLALRCQQLKHLNISGPSKSQFPRGDLREQALFGQLECDIWAPSLISAHFPAETIALSAALGVALDVEELRIFVKTLKDLDTLRPLRKLKKLSVVCEKGCNCFGLASISLLELEVSGYPTNMDWFNLHAPLLTKLDLSGLKGPKITVKDFQVDAASLKELTIPFRIPSLKFGRSCPQLEQVHVSSYLGRSVSIEAGSLPAIKSLHLELPEANLKSVSVHSETLECFKLHAVRTVRNPDVCTLLCPQLKELHLHVLPPSLPELGVSCSSLETLVIAGGLHLKPVSPRGASMLKKVLDFVRSTALDPSRVGVQLRKLMPSLPFWMRELIPNMFPGLISLEEALEGKPKASSEPGPSSREKPEALEVGAKRPAESLDEASQKAKKPRVEGSRSSARLAQKAELGPKKVVEEANTKGFDPLGLNSKKEKAKDSGGRKTGGGEKEKRKRSERRSIESYSLDVDKDFQNLKEVHFQMWTGNSPSDAFRRKFRFGMSDSSWCYFPTPYSETPSNSWPASEDRYPTLAPEPWESHYGVPQEQGQYDDPQSDSDFTEEEAYGAFSEEAVSALQDMAKALGRSMAAPVPPSYGIYGPPSKSAGEAAKPSFESRLARKPRPQTEFGAILAASIGAPIIPEVAPSTQPVLNLNLKACRLREVQIFTDLQLEAPHLTPLSLSAVRIWVANPGAARSKFVLDCPELVRMDWQVG